MNQSNLLTVRVAGVMNRQAVVLHAGRTLPVSYTHLTLPTNSLV